MGNLLTVQQVAERLHLHPVTVRRKVLRGDIPGGVKLGDNWKQSPLRVDEAQLDAWCTTETTFR
jgi:excisionase family DNA binding protein